MKEKPQTHKRAKKSVTKTDDGHYVIIDGRKWRATNPSLSEEKRQELVNELMSARRAVGAAKRTGNKADEQAARARVNKAKVALGERGEKWWEKNEQPTFNIRYSEETQHAT
jgi:hypothetical protein